MNPHGRVLDTLTGLATGAERVTRGGAHDEPADHLRSTYGMGSSRETQGGHRHIGFRCAR